MAINRIPFNKPASSPEQLLQKLERQGLVVDDAKREQARNYMRFVGGYRLKGYWHHLVDPVAKTFPAGYRFEQVVSRWEFERELRVLTMAAIERLEIAVRVVMANHLSLKHSPHWFLDGSLFRQERRQGAAELVAKVEAEVDRACESPVCQISRGGPGRNRLPDRLGKSTWLEVIGTEFSVRTSTVRRR